MSTRVLFNLNVVQINTLIHVYMYIVHITYYRTCLISTTVIEQKLTKYHIMQGYVGRYTLTVTVTDIHVDY